MRKGLSVWIRQHRVHFGFLVAVCVFVLADPGFSSIVSGLPLVILGESVRTWSSGHIKKNKELATDGPYAYTRNPLYFGSFLMGLGFVVIVSNLYVLFLYLFGFITIYFSVMRSEEADLEKAFGKQFLDYHERVPAFFPRVSRGGYGSGIFDWRLVLKHREYNAWLGIIGGVVILLFKAVR